MADAEKERAQAYLNGTASWNDGAGLIIPRAMAEWLRANGIYGPFTIQPSLPDPDPQEAV